MFQYAVSLNFVKKPNLHINVKKGGFDFTQREFELNIFPNLRYRDSSNIIDLLSTLESKYIGRVFLNRLRRTFPIVHIDESNYEIENINHCNRILFLDGYFQSEAYFNKIKDRVRETFAFPIWNFTDNQLFQKIKLAHNPVAVHIRGGDYTNAVNSKIHGILTKDYYAHALHVIKEQRGDVQVFLFTDDVEHSRNILEEFNQCIIASTYSETSWQDMMFMSLCKDFIIANSTFSWWGAWLSEREEKIVVAPKNWFVDIDLNRKWKNIYPSNWILI